MSSLKNDIFGLIIEILSIIVKFVIKLLDMKNIVSILALVVLFSLQNLSAQGLTQDQDRPEVVAKAKITKLTNELGLSGEQSRTLYRAFVIHEVDYKKLVENKNNTESIITSEKKKLDAVLDGFVKKTLTKEQYSRWLSLPKE